MSDPVPWDPRLTSWLDLVEARWAASGLSPLACGEMRARLVEDLVQSMQGGAPVVDLVGVDPTSFADDVASASGHRAQTPITDAVPASTGPWSPASTATARRKTAFEALAERTRFVAAALTGALVGAVAAFYLVQHLGLVGLDSLGVTPGSWEEVVVTLGVFVVAALLAAISGGFAVERLFLDAPLRDRLARSATVALLVSGTVATPLTIAFAATTGYSTMGSVVVVEVGIVVLTLVVGLNVAAHLIWRRPDPSRVPDTAL